MRRTDLKRLVSEAAQRRLAGLRAQGYAALLALPAHHTEKIFGTEAVVSTYRDTIGGGRLHIVVRAVLPGWLGSAFIRADGFGIDPDGAAVPLARDVLKPFKSRRLSARRRDS